MNILTLAPRTPVDRQATGVQPLSGASKMIFLAENLNIHPETIAAIKRRLAAAKINQARKGVIVDLTDDDILRLWIQVPKKLLVFNKEIKKALRKGGDITKVSKYLLTWKSYAAMQTKVMNLDTACIANYIESKNNCRMKVGDTHTDLAKEKISKYRTGQVHSEETCNSISESLTGLTRTVTDKENKSVAAKARWARYREQNKK